MRYIDDGTVSDDTTAKIDNEVRVIRSSSDDFIEFIDTLMLRSEAEEKGKAEGEANKEAEFIRKFHQKGKTVDQISNELDIPIDRIISVIGTQELKK